MLRIFHDTHYDFIKHWRKAAISTIAFIVLGLVLLGYHKARTGHAFNESVEFTGGAQIQLQFAHAAQADLVRSAVDKAGYTGAEVASFGDPEDFLIKVQQKAGVASAIDAQAVGSQIAKEAEQVIPGNPVTVRSAEGVGPRVGSELTTKAITAVLISFIVTLIYLAFRFEWRFGVAATMATAHDILTTAAFLAMMHLEISLTVVAGILTVIGYSLNDTIIIFDRARENLKKQRKESLYDVLNRSINETLPRSVLTHTTVFAATMALLIFAGEVIRPFSWIMAFGVFTGTFSSIYVASPILMWIENRWPRDTASTKGAPRPATKDSERQREQAAPVGAGSRASSRAGAR